MKARMAWTNSRKLLFRIVTGWARREELYDRLYSLDWGEVTANNYGFAPAEGQGPERFQIQLYAELQKLLDGSLELRGGFQNSGWSSAFRHPAGLASVSRAFGTGRRAWRRGRRRWWQGSSTGSRSGRPAPDDRPCRRSRLSRRCGSSFAKACNGASCAPSSGVLPAPPCAVAWTTGVLWPCCAGSMPCWSAWCARGLRPLPGTWWSTVVRSAPSTAAS